MKFDLIIEWNKIDWDCWLDWAAIPVTFQFGIQFSLIQSWKFIALIQTFK